jgi:transcriptional regulator with XRE-family HTH domain
MDNVMLCPIGNQYSRSMRDREPTIRSRELGNALRRAMKRAGFNASQLARQLDWSPSRVSRLLSGKRGGSSNDVSAFLAVCGVRGEEREVLMKLSLDQHRRGWFQQHGARLPKQLRTLIDHENKSAAINSFEFNLIHGLLQTGDYLNALLTEAGRVPGEEIKDRVAAKLGRQGLFSRPDAPMFTFYLHEFALRLPVGGPRVMSDQLHQLLRISVRPNINIRVVPTSVGAHAATAGSFQLMEFRDIDPIVYLDSETSCIFLELPVEIAAYQSILADLETIALPEGQSREFIATLATELYGEDQDGLAKE